MNFAPDLQNVYACFTKQVKGITGLLLWTLDLSVKFTCDELNSTSDVVNTYDHFLIVL